MQVFCWARAGCLFLGVCMCMCMYMERKLAVRTTSPLVSLVCVVLFRFVLQNAPLGQSCRGAHGALRP